MFDRKLENEEGDRGPLKLRNPSGFGNRVKCKDFKSKEHMFWGGGRRGNPD